MALYCGVQKLLNAATATGAGTSFPVISKQQSLQLTGQTTNSTGTATVFVQACNDNTNWLSVGTITLALTTSTATDGFTSAVPWAYWRGNVNALSGTGAAVTLLMGWVDGERT